MTIQRGLTQGFEQEADARRESRNMALALIESLKAEGYTRFAPPLLTCLREHYAADEFADCRVIVSWIEPHLFSEYAGMYAVRVDTLARK